MHDSSYLKSSGLTKGEKGMPPDMDKPTLRSSLRAARAGLGAQTIRAHALDAQRAILADPVWKAARIVALYMALPDEPDTSLLIHMARLERRQVWLPRSLDRAGRMEFALYTGPQTLRPGFGAIAEPDPDLCPAVPEGIGADVVIVPGLGFDRAGYRLGYGGGYYDRQLADPAWAQTRRIGLTFDALCQECLPRDAWDVPVHGIATEKGLTWIV